MALNNRVNGPSLTLVSRGARVQFGIGVALISIIPLLTFWYLGARAQSGDPIFDKWTLIIIPLLMASAFGGYAILRKYPVNIVKLRGYLENMIHGELPEQVDLVKAEDDIAVVEKCLNLILAQLQERLDILQKEKKSLQSQLYQVQKMESLGIMAAGVAHDFNNLLMGIMGNLDLLAMRLKPESEELADLQKVQEFTKRASELTREMLVYAGKGKFVMEKVEVTELIKDMSKLLKASIASGVVFEFDLARNLPPVHADPTQLRQVAMNLVINASDAMKGESGTITISTSQMKPDPKDFEGLFVSGTLPQDECVCLEVLDTGCGMDAETQAKMFDPFFSAAPRGRGLGLAVVLGIVVGHHGAIAVDSKPGQGTDIKVIIPRASAVIR